MQDACSKDEAAKAADNDTDRKVENGWEEISFVLDDNNNNSAGNKNSNLSHYCVCFIDIVNSTEITAQIDDVIKLEKYYSYFLNSIAAIARRFDAKIVKNMGDCLVFYFPKTSDYTDQAAFDQVFDCIFSMVSARASINASLQKEDLSPVDYRISAEYGPVIMAKSKSLSGTDLFGSTMNLCSKLNSKAAVNGVVIGKELYDIVRSFPLANKYVFEQLGRLFIGGSPPRYLSMYSVAMQEEDDSSSNTINNPKRDRRSQYEELL